MARFSLSLLQRSWKKGAQAGLRQCQPRPRTHGSLSRPIPSGERWSRDSENRARMASPEKGWGETGEGTSRRRYFED